MKRAGGRGAEPYGSCSAPRWLRQRVSCFPEGQRDLGGSRGPHPAPHSWQRPPGLSDAALRAPPHPCTLGPQTRSPSPELRATCPCRHAHLMCNLSPPSPSRTRV